MLCNMAHHVSHSLLPSIVTPIVRRLLLITSHNECGLIYDATEGSTGNKFCGNSHGSHL